MFGLIFNQWEKREKIFAYIIVFPSKVTKKLVSFITILFFKSINIYPNGTVSKD
jgi:hypothetical protein